MTAEQRNALTALRFNWAPVPDDVWRPSPFHVEGLHRQIAQDVLNGLADARESADASPIGLVLQGQRGSGKTHLLGWVRQQVQDQGGYFFLVSLLDAENFWVSVVHSMLDGLARQAPNQENQLRVLLRRLCDLARLPRAVRRAVIGETELTRLALDTFVNGLRAFDPYVATDSQETARALALRACDDAARLDVADNYFTSGEEATPGERGAWGMRRAPRSAQLIVKDLSRLLALTGPAVIAVDQIDTLIAQSTMTTTTTTFTTAVGTNDWQHSLLLEQIAGGLMSLREHTRRTLTVVACIPASWALLESKATDTVRDRFRSPGQLKTIGDGDIGRAIMAKRFAAHFASIGFDPPYPTWPVTPSAFDGAAGFTPRQLLMKIDQHIRSCLLAGEIRELDHLGAAAAAGPDSDVGRPTVGADLAVFDARYAVLRTNADVRSPLDAAIEDTTMPALLSAGLTAWIIECGEAGEAYHQDPPPSAKPALHARLRLTLDESTEDEMHWSFRAIAHPHPVAALNRLRAASTMAGLTERVTKRKLFLLRNRDWSQGPKTQEVLAAFTHAGGRVLSVSTDDLRSLDALRVLLAENAPDLQTWLASRRPAGGIEIFQTAFGVQPTGPGRDDSAAAAAATAAADAGVDGPTRELPVYVQQPPPASPADHEPALTVGRTFATGAQVLVGLEALRKHTAIFAGSGSGKTVLIRRLVEECALAGVSSIVLDPNNDLARLGDPWPEPPPQWGDGDADKAAEYLANTDVVIWTPRRDSGRPLSFQPLPDFRSVVDDPDEFAEAVEAAVASVVPRAKLDGRTNKAHLGQAVLRKAIEHYGRRGGSRLNGLIDLLADLPDGVSELDGAEKIAADLAQTLTAAMVNDPLFGGAGTPVDPGILLTPPPGKRARVSVISLIGLQSDDHRQSFVNQLQMALFAWIKKNPAGDRPLGGLFVMDEAQTLAPSGAMTACTQSTLALVSQARKYGLGLVFATQAPKGLHNRIPGNTATQFFGLLNSPIQIEAARGMAQAKGGDVPDISRLGSGQFYVAVEGEAFAKVRTPLCLSHHPRSPLTTEEVIERANAS